MRFLIDENLPTSLGQELLKLGVEVECVYDKPMLRGKSDEAIFDYLISNNLILLTCDVGFVNPLRFQLSKAAGLVLIRFPNEISTATLVKEISHFIQDLKSEDFSRNLIVMEPGSIRKRRIQ